MTYPNSHESYELYDSQDAYNPPPIRYTGYGYPAYQRQEMPKQEQVSPYPPYQPYSPYTQSTSYGAYPTQTQRTPNAPTTQHAPVKKPQAKVQKRSKAESLALISRLKKWIVAASMVGFGSLSLLVAGHAVGVTSNATTTTSNTKSTTTITTPTTTSTTSNSGSFFQQQQSQSQSQQSGQGGYSFGNSNSQQGAVSGSSAS